MFIGENTLDKHLTRRIKNSWVTYVLDLFSGMWASIAPIALAKGKFPEGCCEEKSDWQWPCMLLWTLWKQGRTKNAILIFA